MFDVAFTNESSFMFDPDADNWRRKTVSLSREITYGKVVLGAHDCVLSLQEALSQ